MGYFKQLGALSGIGTALLQSHRRLPKLGSNLFIVRLL